LQTAYQSSGWKKGSFPVTEKMSDELLSLPIGPHINYQKVDYVCEVLIKALKE
jgi:dTDP-4-amino-4,6-dideoxygalactose transaminase